jgi:hypothetical protein
VAVEDSNSAVPVEVVDTENLQEALQDVIQYHLEE